MNALQILPVALLLAACSTTTPGHSARAADSIAVTASATPELPLPPVPDTLRLPADRATYLLDHFWDAMDFADTALTRSEAFMEPNFVNYVNLYPHAHSAKLAAITARFLRRATADTPSRLLLYGLIDKYLSNSDSPVFDDNTYITFLDQWVKLPGIDPYELEEPRYRLTAALKNRPGTPAADFSYVTPDGKTSTLYATEAPATLLLFYDPDCDHCRATIASLRDNREITRLAESGALTVLAVYVGDDDELWLRDLPSMPPGWVVASDRSRVLDNELYDIPEMPGLYLLTGAGKTVDLRAPSIGKLTGRLAKM